MKAYTQTESREAAETLELDNAHFVVSAKDYDAFLAALDEPPRVNPALQKLFAEPHLIDVPNSPINFRKESCE